jgi:hypothetical protein
VSENLPCMPLAQSMEVCRRAIDGSTNSASLEDDIKLFKTTGTATCSQDHIEA